MLQVVKGKAEFGKIIENIDLEHDLDEAAGREIRDLLRIHGVLVFKKQDGLTPAGQVRLARYIGTPFPVPKTMAIVGSDAPDVMVLDDRFPIEDAGWHSDGTPSPRPPYCTILRAVRVPASAATRCGATCPLPMPAFRPGCGNIWAT